MEKSLISEPPPINGWFWWRLVGNRWRLRCRKFRKEALLRLPSKPSESQPGTGLHQLLLSGTKKITTLKLFPLEMCFLCWGVAKCIVEAGGKFRRFALIRNVRVTILIGGYVSN